MRRNNGLPYNMLSVPTQQSLLRTPKITLNDASLTDQTSADPYRFTRFSRNTASCRINSNRLVYSNTQHCNIVTEFNRSGLSRNNSVQSPTTLPPNMQESDLDILGLIGVGAFGRALKARHKKYGCLLVVKEVLQENKEDEEALNREICLLRHLKHPNILMCMGVVVRNKKICLVTEYVERGSLHNLLLGSTPEKLNWHKRVSFARDIAAGMAFLHERDLVHRDLTTHNCLVRQDDSVVVSDFGLSKIVLSECPPPHPTDSTSKAENGHLSINVRSLERPPVCDSYPTGGRRKVGRQRKHTVVGNPFWMAPEMLSGKPYDHRVDVYSFGVILCQLIGQCDADPDQLPRNTRHFAVEIDEFLAKCNLKEETFPKLVVETARQCVNIDPAIRPSFLDCHHRLNSCLFYLISGRNPPLKTLADK